MPWSFVSGEVKYKGIFNEVASVLVLEVVTLLFTFSDPTLFSGFPQTLWKGTPPDCRKGFKAAMLNFLNKTRAFS